MVADMRAGEKTLEALKQGSSAGDKTLEALMTSLQQMADEIRAGGGENISTSKAEKITAIINGMTQEYTY